MRLRVSAVSVLLAVTALVSLGSWLGQLGEWLLARAGNLQVMTKGPWEQLVTFRATPVQERRAAELDSTFFALGWWGLGFVALGAIALGYVRVRVDVNERAGLATALAWVAATLTVWLLLVFLPDGAMIRHGSYTPLLVLLPALALALWRVHPALLAATAAAQWVMVPALWLTPSPAMPVARPRPDLLVLLVASIVGLGLVAAVGWRGSRGRPTDTRDVQQSDEEPTLGAERARSRVPPLS